MPNEVLVRGATPRDYPAIRDLLSDAFNNPDDESGIFDALIANDPSFAPDCARLVVVDDVPTAMAVVRPRNVRTRAGWVAGAELTLVGCRTALQGRGYGSLAVRDALAYMRDRGLALAVFYGEPGYYPRFGAAPVFPAYRAVLSVSVDASNGTVPGAAVSQPPVAAGLIVLDDLLKAHAAARLERATDNDIPALTRLYRDAMCVYSGAVARETDPWEWRPRDPEVWQVQVLSDRSAYAVTKAEHGELFVREAGAADGAAAQRLLAALVAAARATALRQVTAVLPPDHLLHRAMALCGADSQRRPASAGFAMVTDWSRVLPDGYAVDNDNLSYLGQPLLAAGTIPLTQLAMGYLDIDDLLLLPGCRVVGDEARVRLRREFPRLHPRYSWAPFYLLH